ncbi:MAG: transporter substrate-binding domain-containing protein [Candidatus Azobacteroides sp.]|nr:transporter substrate-binding domain-containing protein [Candidatus Azobacteroides sp.]
MKISRAYIRRFLPFILLLFFILISCRFNKNNSNAVEDLMQIFRKGEINVLTLSGSMSYFIYKGEPKGYEYDLLSDFAKSLNLKINIRLAENETKLTEMLLQGEGDLIAYNIPITNTGKEQVLYCGREVINEQVLVQRANKGDTLITDVTGLIGKEVWVIHNSKFHKRLKNLNDELGGGIRIRTIEKDTVNVEDLIEMVSKGEIPYTLSDVDMAKFNKTYFNNIDITLLVGHSQRSSWAVRKTNPSLAEAVDKWFEDNRNAPEYKRIVKRYFEVSKMPLGNEPIPKINAKRISPFDDFFKEYARGINWDWRLLASISYQESRFFTDCVSWAGAAGLMGLMPETAEELGLPPDQIYDPEKNIKASAGYIKKLNRLFSTIENEDERIKFIVASYNSGPGHVLDAQALALKFDKNPEDWNDVEEYLKLKNLPEYYNDPVCKSGYFRSTETVNYVQNVIERWRYYQEKVNN